MCCSMQGIARTRSVKDWPDLYQRRTDLSGTLLLTNRASPITNNGIIYASKSPKTSNTCKTSIDDFIKSFIHIDLPHVRPKFVEMLLQ